VLEYRLQPSPQILARFDQSATALVAALGAIRADGDTADRALADRVLLAHQDYLAATDQLFGAANRGDAPTVARVNNNEVLASHLAIEQELTGAAADKHQLTLGGWAHLQWLREQRQHVPLMTSVCTGSTVFAAAGLLHDRAATTNRTALDQLTRIDETIIVKPGQQYVDDGDIITAAGISAGIDMALHIVGRLTTPERARQVRDGIEYHPESTR